MSSEAVTIQDCIEANEMRGWGVILEHGQVIGFEKGGRRVE